MSVSENHLDNAIELKLKEESNKFKQHSYFMGARKVLDNISSVESPTDEDLKAVLTILGPVANAAHFVMGFMDLNLYMISNYDDSVKDNVFQKAMNEHTQEDKNHFAWFLQDLDVLWALNPELMRNSLNSTASNDDAKDLSYADVLRAVYHENNADTRVLTYKLAAMSYNEEPHFKFMMHEAVEVTGEDWFTITAELAEVINNYLANHHKGEGTPAKLKYFGKHHLESDAGNYGEVLDDHHAEIDIEIDKLSEADIEKGVKIIEETFVLFHKLFDVFQNVVRTNSNMEMPVN